jgi:hypothetical protein
MYQLWWICGILNKINNKDMQKSDGKYWQFAVTTGLTSLQIN